MENPSGAVYFCERKAFRDFKAPPPPSPRISKRKFRDYDNDGHVKRVKRSLLIVNYDMCCFKILTYGRRWKLIVRDEENAYNKKRTDKPTRARGVTGAYFSRTSLICLAGIRLFYLFVWKCTHIYNTHTYIYISIKLEPYKNVLHRDRFWRHHIRGRARGANARDNGRSVCARAGGGDATALYDLSYWSEKVGGGERPAESFAYVSGGACSRKNGRGQTYPSSRFPGRDFFTAPPSRVRPPPDTYYSLST